MTEQDKSKPPAGYKPPALVQGGKVAPIIPTDLDQAWRLAGIIAGAGMAPESYDRSIDKVMIGIMHGLEVGFTPMAALQSIAVINGTPSIWGDGALALVENSELLEDMEETLDGEGDAMVATCTMKRKGRKTLVTRQFSISDAKTANLTNKDPWKKYPQRMLQMRARSWAMRDGFADVLRGLRITEEVQDSTLINVSPAPPRPTAAIEHVDPVTAQPEEPEASFRFTNQYGESFGAPASAGEFMVTLIEAMNGCHVGGALNALLEHNADDIESLPEPLKADMDRHLEFTNKRLRDEAEEKPVPEVEEPEADAEPEKPTEGTAVQYEIEPPKDAKGRVKELEYQKVVLAAVRQADGPEIIDAILLANKEHIDALPPMYANNILKVASEERAKFG